MYLLNNLLTQAQVYDLESPLFFYLFIYLDFNKDGVIVFCLITLL